MSKNPTTKKRGERFRVMVAPYSAKNGLSSVDVFQYASLVCTVFVSNPMTTPDPMGFSDTL